MAAILSIAARGNRAPSHSKFPLVTPRRVAARSPGVAPTTGFDHSAAVLTSDPVDYMFRYIVAQSVAPRD